jgi:hypothetical protein
VRKRCRRCRAQVPCRSWITTAKLADAKSTLPSRSQLRPERCIRLVPERVLL